LPVLRDVPAFTGQDRAALDGILAGSDSAARLLDAVPAQDRQAVQDAAASASVSGFRAAMFVAALLAVAGAVAAALLTGRPAGEPVPASRAGPARAVR
jgi:hypothetical protein